MERRSKHRPAVPELPGQRGQPPGLAARPGHAARQGRAALCIPSSAASRSSAPERSGCSGSHPDTHSGSNPGSHSSPRLLQEHIPEKRGVIPSRSQECSAWVPLVLIGLNTELSFSFCSICHQKGMGGCNTFQACGLIYKGLVYKISSQF